MAQYRDYTVELELGSPIVTKFQADTIFGHICWAMRFLKWDTPEGGDRLGEFLRLYDQEGGPPLLVSDGFPGGYLPRPVLPPITQQELDDVVGPVSLGELVRNSHKIKAVKNLEYVPAGDFARLNSHWMDPVEIFRQLFQAHDPMSGDSHPGRTTMVQHNTVDRVRNMVMNGLYSQEETFYSNDFRKFKIYVRTSYFTREDLARIFEFIGEDGYGKDKSTGKGHFTSIVREGNELVENEDANGFMTLSSFIPKRDDPRDGYYKILHKYGKLGGSFAESGLGRNPFKKPLLMFAAGSVFRDYQYQRGKTYGSLLRDVHPSGIIRHYAYAFPIGIRLKDGL